MRVVGRAKYNIWINQHLANEMDVGFDTINKEGYSTVFQYQEDYYWSWSYFQASLNSTLSYLYHSC